MPRRRRDRTHRPPPDRLTAMGTTGLAGPGFAPGDIFARHARPSARGHGPAVSPDARIHDDVCDALTDDPELDASGLEVAVEGGVATLGGSVPVRAMKGRAEEVAERVSGVKEVDNRIRVRRAPM